MAVVVELTTGMGIKAVDTIIGENQRMIGQQQRSCSTILADKRVLVEEGDSFLLPKREVPPTMVVALVVEQASILEEVSSIIWLMAM